MQKFKKNTIFDYLNEKLYNIFFDEITDSEESLIWSAKKGDVKAQIAYLKMSDPATWDEKSKAYKDKMKREEQKPMFIDVYELLDKNELEEYKSLNASDQEEYITRKLKERNQ